MSGERSTDVGVLGRSSQVGVIGEGRTRLASTDVRQTVLGCADIRQGRRRLLVQCRSTRFAGHFKGDVLVDGDFTVTGAKGAVVPHPDGSHRLFCAIESPESWFEDFAEATLEGGRAEIELDPDFVQLTKTDRYHVFYPYGASHGLYVERRTKSFVVREQQDGKSHVSFSYRVVAKRGDIDVPRFKKMAAPPDVPATSSASRRCRNTARLRNVSLKLNRSSRHRETNAAAQRDPEGTSGKPGTAFHSRDQIPMSA